MAGGDHPDNLRTRKLRPSKRRPVFLRPRPRPVPTKPVPITACSMTRAMGDPNPPAFRLIHSARGRRECRQRPTTVCGSPPLGPGLGANQSLMSRIADIGQGEHFRAEGSTEEYSVELEQTFRRLGGTRPVEVIQ